MPQTKDHENVHEGQPRDSKGRYASWGLAGDGINESAKVLEHKLVSGSTAEIVAASQHLIAAVNRVPTLTPLEAEQISSVAKTFGAGAIPTDIWLELDRACRNASSSARDHRATIDKKRLTARAQRDRAEINRHQ
ncbi:MAG: hypothetical protein KTV68_08620 [Acidimicrobiia bacterium]|nr:hypothetical protein [Acidimicrobiia bacterium]MCY4434430.1 hypothetical protein [bacterium]